MAQEATSGNYLYLGINSNGFLYRPANDAEKAEFFAKLGENASYTGGDMALQLVKTTTGEYLHKVYRRTETGKITKIEKRVKKFDDGKEVTTLDFYINPDNGAQIEVVRVPVYGQEGLSRLVKKIITLLPNLDLSRSYCIAPMKGQFTKADGTEGTDITIFFNYEENGDRKALKNAVRYKSSTHPDGEIPAAVKKLKMGKDSWDFSDQDEYLYHLMENELTRLQNELKQNETKTSNNPPSTSTTKVQTPPPVQETTNSNATNSGIDAEDDLPF